MSPEYSVIISLVCYYILAKYMDGTTGNTISDFNDFVYIDT